MNSNNKQIPQATLNGPIIRISCTGNVYVRHMLFWKEGIVELGHRHPYSHTSLVAAGSVRFQVYDDHTGKLLDPVEYHAPAMIFVEKGRAHQMTSLEDNTVVCCIHALRDEDHEIIDPDMFPVPQGMKDAVLRYEELTGRKLEAPYQMFDNLSPKRIPRVFDAEDCF